MAKLTKQQLVQIVQLQQGVGQFSDKERESLQALIENKRATVEEAMFLIDIKTAPLVYQYNAIKETLDTLEVLLVDKFDLSEEDFDKAEKKAKEMNEKAFQEQVKAFQEQVKKLEESGELDKALEEKGKK